MSVIDLHCDLLSFLQHDLARTPLDAKARCSFPQLKTGGVQLQVMALFTETTRSSVQEFQQQLEILKALPKRYPKECLFYNGTLNEKIALLAAIENASGLCTEEDPLEDGLERLRTLLQSVPCLYISLTWNEENRFGGGALTTIGLKEEGKRLIEAIEGKKIALDLSHASDRLAEEALNFIDSRSLQIPVLASHSNFRTRCNHPRNLPDEIAREIIRRKGIIGLVFYQKFLNPPSKQGLLNQIEQGFKLGAEQALAFGSDFFCTDDFPEFAVGFIEGLSDASQYGTLLSWLKEWGLSPSLFSENALRFIHQVKTGSLLKREL